MTIRKLKKREKLDNLQTTRRATKRGLGRFIYLGIMAGICFLALDFMVGDLVLLRADGLVLRERHIIGATYPAQIRKVMIKPGQTICDGDKLLELESHEVLSNIASLSSRYAKLVSQLAEDSSKLQSSRSMLPLARKRLRMASILREKYQKPAFMSVITNRENRAVLNDLYLAQKDTTELESRQSSLSSKIVLLVDAKEELRSALKELKRHYRHGNIHAPLSGFAGAKLPNTGQVVKSGDTLLEIFSGPSYVLAFVPTGTLYQIKPGNKVVVSNGFQDMDGEITELLPIAKSLPTEFQQSFGTKKQGQIVRIKLLNTLDLPVYTKVTVKGDHWKKAKAYLQESEILKKARGKLNSLWAMATNRSRTILTWARANYARLNKKQPLLL